MSKPRGKVKNILLGAKDIYELFPCWSIADILRYYKKVGVKRRLSSIMADKRLGNEEKYWVLCCALTPEQIEKALAKIGLKVLLKEYLMAPEQIPAMVSGGLAYASRTTFFSACLGFWEAVKDLPAEKEELRCRACYVRDRRERDIWNLAMRPYKGSLDHCVSPPEGEKDSYTEGVRNE